MKELPKGGLIGKAVNAGRAIGQMHIPLHAANAGYFIVLAIFPALLLILSILRYTSLEVDTLVEVLATVLPAALMESAEDLVVSTYMNSSGAVVGLSAVTALWSASRGVYGLTQGLNAIYDLRESRGYLYTRILSLVYTILLFVAILLSLLLHVFGNGIIDLLLIIDNPVVIFIVDLVDFRFILLLVVESLIFTLMFMALPNRRNRFWASLPGGVLTSLGWLVFSDIFSIYVENFNRYSNIYGSVYAVALGMLWLYCCMCIFFCGGALNRWLMGQKE